MWVVNCVLMWVVQQDRNCLIILFNLFWLYIDFFNCDLMDFDCITIRVFSTKYELQTLSETEKKYRKKSPMRDLNKEKPEKEFCCSVFTEKKRLGELVKKQTRSFEVVFLDNVIGRPLTSLEKTLYQKHKS